jgi:hypothetical protein
MHFTAYANILRGKIAEYAQQDPRFRNYSTSMMGACGLNMPIGGAHGGPWGAFAPTGRSGLQGFGSGLFGMYADN